jgi:hypothetical protein
VLNLERPAVSATNPRAVPTPHWSKSSRSANNGACVEVAFAPDLVATRDSKDPTGPALVFHRSAWTTFVAAVKNGDHDLH